LLICCRHPNRSLRKPADHQWVRIRTFLATLCAFAITLALPLGTASAAPAAHAPKATTEPGSAISAVGAVVGVAINALGLLTHYVVQFGTTTTYGNSTPARTVASATGTDSYQVALAHLQPSTVYHYRVAATNLLGTTYGDDQTFATWPVQIPFNSRGVVSPNNLISKPKNEKPKGWVMVIHGGGWQSVGREDVASEDSTAAFVTHLGWAADNIDYRKGEHSLPDVLAAYDALRKRVGNSAKICLLGHSAGGNLALLAAEHRRSVSCVISGAGPTDLVHFAEQKAYKLTSLLGALYTPAWAFEQYMITSFGINPKVLARWSPADHASELHVPLLLGASTYDPLVPQHQMAELRTAMKAAHSTGTIKTVLLAGAKTPNGQAPNFVHASITKHAMTIWQRDERQLLEQVASAA
jgi:dipeptidyl aminopeptidase/acylaminoacyl peptidase